MTATAPQQAPPRSGPRPGPLRELRALARDTSRGLRGHDLALYSAGVTFYGGIALVPSLLVAVWVASLVIGDAAVATYAERLAESLPERLGAPDVARNLIRAGSSLSPVTALLAVVPASMYGDGLRRAFARLADYSYPVGSWRGRLRVLPLLAVAPLLMLALLLATPVLASLFGSGQVQRTALGVYIAFLSGWVVLSLPLAYVYKVVGPASPSWRSALWGGFSTGSFVSGFLQGFLVFLALPLDLGAPFGGFTVLGGIVAVMLWLWLLHGLVLVGYELTRAVDDRNGRPWRPSGVTRAATTSGSRALGRG